EFTLAAEERSARGPQSGLQAVHVLFLVRDVAVADLQELPRLFAFPGSEFVLPFLGLGQALFARERFPFGDLRGVLALLVGLEGFLRVERLPSSEPGRLLGLGFASRELRPFLAQGGLIRRAFRHPPVSLDEAFLEVCALLAMLLRRSGSFFLVLS